ncbi:MAG: RNA chaperone Hfq [Blastocatellia bacterium]|nr:RNA chaperone Hfq [Blastocatellia bacterium]
MQAKKKTEDTSETTAIKTPRKRATKKAIESEVVASNDSTVTSEAVEVVEAFEIKEVNKATNDKSVEVVGTLANVNIEVTESANLEAVEVATVEVATVETATVETATVETIADNNQTTDNNLDGELSEGNQNKTKRPGTYVQRKFYERVIGEKREVTVQLEKLKMTGVITYESRFYILLETKQGEQFIYKQSISYISTKRSFTKLSTRRDKPFFNREKVDGDNSANPNNEQVKEQNTEQVREVTEVTYDASNRNESNLANSQ